MIFNNISAFEQRMIAQGVDVAFLLFNITIVQLRLLTQEHKRNFCLHSLTTTWVLLAL